MLYGLFFLRVTASGWHIPAEGPDKKSVAEAGGVTIVPEAQRVGGKAFMPLS